MPFKHPVILSIKKLLCSLPNLRTALVAELRAGLEFMLAIRAFRRGLRGTTFGTELRARFQFSAALHALHGCGRCGAP